MIVDVLGIEPRGADSEGNELYHIRLQVDGREYTIRLFKDGEERPLRGVGYVDDLAPMLFLHNQFYIAALLRLLRDYIGGYRPRVPMRLIEAGDGARYLREEPDPS
jgi:hypothetical protein